MTTADITSKINALRAETEKNSVSPENVGYLLQLVYDYAISVNNLTTQELKSLHAAIENIEYADLTSGGTIDGDLYVNGNARIAESLLVQGVSSFSKSVTIHEGLWVHGGSYLYDGLLVAGRASFINSVIIDENLSVGGDVTANGNALIFGDAKVQGTLMCVSSFNSNTVTTIAGLDSFRIGSTTDPASGWGTYIWSYGNGHGFIQQGSAISGKAFTLKLQPFGGNVGIGWGNNASAQYTLDVNGAIRGIGAIYAGRGLYVGNESGAYGEVRIYDYLGDLLFYANPSPGYIHIKGQFLDVSPVARFADGIQITGSTITDSLTVNGNASVTGSLSIGGVLLETDGYILGKGKTLMFGGDGISVDAIQVLGSILADNAIMYVADITTDALTVNGNTSVAGSLTVNSNTTIGGTLTIGNYVSFNNEFINIGRANASDITVESEYSILLYAPTVYIGYNNQFVLNTDGITLNATATINGNTSVSGNVTVGTHFSIDSHTGDFSGRLYTGAVDCTDYTQLRGIFVVQTTEPMELDVDVNIYGFLNVHSPATFGKVTATNVTAQSFSTPDDGTLNVGTALQVVGDDGVTMQNVYIHSGLRVETWAQFKESAIFAKDITLGYYTDSTGANVSAIRAVTLDQTQNVPIFGFDRNASIDSVPKLVIGDFDSYSYGYYAGVSIIGQTSVAGSLTVSGQLTTSHSLVIGYNATAFESALWAKAEDNSTQRLIALTGDATSARYLEIGDSENSIVDSVVINGPTEITGVLSVAYIDCYDGVTMQGKLYVGDIATFYDEAHFSVSTVFSGTMYAESDIWAHGDIRLLYHSNISEGVHTALTASWAANGTEICVAGLHDNDEKIILGIGSQSYASSNAPDTIALITSYETGSIELIGNVYVPQTFRLGGATFTYDATNDRVTCDKDIVTVAPSAA